MADNVEVKFGADSTKMAKEFEKMRDKIASLTSQVERLTDRSKQSGRAGKDAFSGMSGELSKFALNAVSVTAAYAAIQRGITAVIEKTKELRALRDQAAISTSSVMNKINKEYGLEGTAQDKMQGWLQGNAQANKMKVDKLAQFVASGANEGMQKEDLYSNKYKSAIEMFNVSDNLTGDQAVNLLQTGLKKKGKSFKTASKEDIDSVAGFLATMKSDLASADTEMGSLEKDIGFEESVVLLDMAKKNRYGKGKKSASDINEGYKKSKLRGAVKAAGYENYEQFQADLESARSESKTALPQLQRIQAGSRESELAYSENKKMFAFEEGQKDKELNIALESKRLAREQENRTNIAERTINSQIAGQVGEENLDTTKTALSYASNIIPGVTLTRLIMAVTGTSESIDKQNTLRSKDAASKKIDMKTDSKGIR